MRDTSLLDLSQVAPGIGVNANMFIRQNFDLLTNHRPVALLGQAGKKIFTFPLSGIRKFSTFPSKIIDFHWDLEPDRQSQNFEFRLG